MAASRPSSSIVGSPSVHSSNKQGASPPPFVISTAPSFCHLDRPFLLSSRPPLPFVISTKRSAWRDLSTTLEMTKVLHLISLSPCFATDFRAVPLLCRKKTPLSHASRMKMKKKLGMSPIFIVSLHRQSDKTSSERHQKTAIKRAKSRMQFELFRAEAVSSKAQSVNNKFNNKKLKKGNKLWQRM